MVMEMLGAGGLSPHPFTPLPKVGGGGQLVSHPCFATRQATVGVSPPVPPRDDTPAGSISPGDRGDRALRDGRAFQLHPKEKDTRLVACPQARWLLLTLKRGLAGSPGPKLG